MRKCNQKKVSVLTLLMFFITLVSNVIISPLEKVKAADITADNMAVVVGDFLNSNGLGADWAPSNLNGLMKVYKDGLYETSLDLKAGNYQYKIAMNGNWDESYGKEGKNIDLKLSSDTKVIFRLDYKNKTVYDSINNPDQFKAKAIWTGGIDNLVEGGQVWNPEDDNFALDYIGGGCYQKTFEVKNSAKAANYDLEYKVAFNGSWGNGEVGYNGQNVKVTIPAGTDKITIFANYLKNFATDSVSTPELLKIPSLIGTIRGEKDQWSEKTTGWEFTPLDNNGIYVYSGVFNKGTYDYKAVVNYSWDGGGIPSQGNNSIAVANDGKYVIFICDVKAGKLYDSVNNYHEVAQYLNLEKKQTELSGPKVNLNGTVRFIYKNDAAKDVAVAGNFNGWNSSANKLVFDKDEGYWYADVRVGDAEQDIQYKFIVDGNWIKDPSNSSTISDEYGGENSLFKFPKYEGRKVVIAGTIQGVIAGQGNWDPASEKTKMVYKGDGLYEYTFTDVPAGNYEYKVAMGAWDPENYGANGVAYGDNIKISVPSKRNVTLYYNDDSHYIVDSINYKVMNILLEGLSSSVKLVDKYLTGIYSCKVQLEKGKYSNLTLNVDGNIIKVPELSIDENREVTISFDPVTEMVLNDAASTKLNDNEILFDSKDLEYKKPFGAVKTDEEVTFNLKTAKNDAIEAKLVINGPLGSKIVDMTKNGQFDEYHDKWTGNVTFDKIGQYTYYFIISNGADVKTYSDDDGFFGTGKVGDLKSVKKYELNVYDKDFKTPDWMKNGVVYQIFPDRFFNGDKNNDYLQKLARGTTPYEFYKDWYALTENPTLEDEPDYKGTKGDGQWCNEMYGGDLAGISEKLDYLKSLGISVLYLNPIGASISSHRYDTTDYTKVDPLLGDMNNFVNLASEAGKRGMHLVLDGVFNHVSDDSIYFDRYGKYISSGKPLGAYQYWSRVYDLMNSQNLNQQEAEKTVTAALARQGITDIHYKDWFAIENNKVDVGLSTEHYNYEGWWGFDSMPVIKALNGSEYQVQSWASEIIDGKDAVSRMWLKKGSNGWRLDVANEVSDETWQHFRKAVKEEGDNVIIGEIWTDASKYILGDMYDSVMNYRFRGAVLDYISGTGSAFSSMKELEKMREQYPREALEAMLNLVDSHDTQRVLSAFDGWDKSEKGYAGAPSETALKKMRLVPLVQMTYPGAPTIYYGDEAGMVGADDPDNRRGMIWGKGNKDLVEWYALLANIRNNYSVLRTGDIIPAQVDNSMDDILAYTRVNEENKAAVAVNRSDAAKKVVVQVKGISEGTTLTNVVGNKETYVVKNSSIELTLPAYGGAILVDKVKDITVNNEELKAAYAPDYIVKERSEERTNPGTPTTPSSPETPTTPSSPGTPATPSSPETPATPSSPETPATPSSPETPATPSNPETPATPSNPETPATPSNPEIPATPSNPGTPTTPSNPETPSKVVVKDIVEGKVPVEIKGLDNKDGVNTISIPVPNNAKSVEVTINDINTIKNGTGKLDINLSSGIETIIPFESIDKSLLAEGAKVVLNLIADSNSDIIKNLKGVKKVYEFGLDVVNGDNKTSIHNFKKGYAQITVTLSDEELKGLDRTNLAVFYYNETTKKFEMMETKIDGNKVTFKTPHFSKFVIAEKVKKVGNTTENTKVLPKTGSVIDSNVLIIAGILLIVAGFTVMFSRKRKMV